MNWLMTIKTNTYTNQEFDWIEVIENAFEIKYPSLEFLNSSRDIEVTRALNGLLTNDSTDLSESTAVMTNLLTQLQRESNWRDVVGHQLIQGDPQIALYTLDQALSVPYIYAVF